MLSWLGRPRTFCLPFPGKYVLLFVCLYQFLSFLSTIAKTRGRNNRQFQKVQAVGTDSFMVLVVCGSKSFIECDRNLLGMAAVLYSVRGGAEHRPLSFAGTPELSVL